eukprot:scaffold108748_cov36-Tisochrysis_lutea.AAC.1
MMPPSCATGPTEVMPAAISLALGLGGISCPPNCGLKLSVASSCEALLAGGAAGGGGGVGSAAYPAALAAVSARCCETNRMGSGWRPETAARSAVERAISRSSCFDLK